MNATVKAISIECMTLLRQLNPFLQRYTLPSNSTYLSSTSQNEMIECCSQEVTATIVSEMRESKTEQLAPCEIGFNKGYSEGEVPSPYRGDTV